MNRAYVVFLLLGYHNSLKFFPSFRYNSREKISSSGSNRASFHTFSSIKPVIDWNILPPQRGIEDVYQNLNSTRLELIVSSQPTTTVSVEELAAKWIDKTGSHDKDINSFSLEDALPFLIQEDCHVGLANRTVDNMNELSEDEIYITEQELQRLWLEASVLPFGKPMKDFDLEESLLLLPDEDYDIIMGGSNQADILKEIQKYDINSSEEPEIFVTEDELERLWNERAEIQWGMPSPQFDAKMALLFLDDEDDEEDDTEYISALHATTMQTDENGFWNKYDDPSDQNLRELLKRIYLDLEDTSYIRPAWKKDRHILTPDIESQRFMGDIMNSNTYMTTRIPANWDDPEAEEMSETYHSTSTMAWPGEPEVDYNDKKPAWEVLDLPIGPLYDMEDDDDDDSSSEEVETDDSNSISVKGNEIIDWSTFDFATDGTFSPDDRTKAISSSSSTGTSGSTSLEDDSSLDVESFFRSIDPSTAAVVEVGDELLEPSDSFEVEHLDSTKVPEKPEDIPFITPKEWMQNPEFANHVGVEVWGNYDPVEFAEADDRWWDEDVYLAMSMKHVMRVTDEYLNDHTIKSADIDDIKYWERKLVSSFTNEDHMKEPIPSYLTPDKDRGVEYSDDIIEMKGKKTLHPWQPPPAIMFENDTFSPNEDVMPVMKTGTVREQYNWEPTGDPADYEIDPEVLEKIRPVLRMGNFIADLKSTKNNTLIFEYHGTMRHIVGIRATLMAVAKECLPELV
eukprot:gene6161-12476_t